MINSQFSILNSQFFLGCAVWAYKEWVGDLFPPGTPARDFLRVYSRCLTTVEGNTTFYAVPKADVVHRWAEETPETFRFCLKLPQEISHNGRLATQMDATKAFLDRVAPLGSRLGPLFLQLPPRYGPNEISDLDQWLAAWPSEYRIAVEVRQRGWYAPAGEAALQSLLERHNAGRVLMDVRPLDLGPLPGAEQDLQRARDNKPNVPLHPVHSGGIALVRYISHPDVPLNAGLLDEWAKRVAQWLGEGVEVYFFVHCPVERLSPIVCREVQRRMEQVANVPPLPWNEKDAKPKQQSLF